MLSVGDARRARGRAGLAPPIGAGMVGFGNTGIRIRLGICQQKGCRLDLWARNP